MTKLYEMELEVQIRKLRNTAIGFLFGGAVISYNLLKYHHHAWALMIAIIAVQAALGSFIIMKDIKRDLQHQKEPA